MATTCKLIAKQQLTSTASSVSFTNLPSAYTDLSLVVSARQDNSDTIIGPVFIRFNGSSSSYSNRALVAYFANNTVASYTNLYSVTSASWVGDTPSTNLTSNTFGNLEVYIPNYAGSTNKSFSMSVVSEHNGNADYTWICAAGAGLWSNTAAITSLELFAGNLGNKNFVSGSNFYLYGITKS